MSSCTDFMTRCEINVKMDPDFVLGYTNMAAKERQNPNEINEYKNVKKRKKNN